MMEIGIILPVFSLPSRYGIGDFGEEAYKFIDILNQNNISYWEILPINACNRLPYSPVSYYALNESYISLDKLAKMGLINKPEYREASDKVLYDKFKEKYYKEAFENFNETEDYREFIKLTEIEEYAEYMGQNNPDNPKEYYLFLQYILHTQWIELKKYANSKNIKIIGDMPIYPAFDSAETKYHPEYFKTENGRFTLEAGTPPDLYTATGQKWNCPVYDVERIKNNNFEYLVKRFTYFLSLYNKVRVDHFRGYDSFYSIPLGKDGTEGFYTEGVGYAFFDELFKNKDVKPNDLLVEDLGDIRRETIELKEHYKFTGQRIFQTSINVDNMYIETDSTDNIVLMPSNHDSHTIYGWYKTLSPSQQEKLKLWLKENNCDCNNINLGIIQYCMKYRAKIVLFTVQDIMGLDDTARINIPGTALEDNWSWKLIDFKKIEECIKQCFQDKIC